MNLVMFLGVIFALATKLKTSLSKVPNIWGQFWVPLTLCRTKVPSENWLHIILIVYLMYLGQLLGFIREYGKRHRAALTKVMLIFGAIGSLLGEQTPQKGNSGSEN